VYTLRFLVTDGKIELVVMLSREPYGSFLTEIESGAAKSFHAPTGHCVKWTSGSWSGDHLHEKMLATDSRNDWAGAALKCLLASSSPSAFTRLVSDRSDFAHERLSFR
jgi:hypothetical protein